MRNRRLLWQMYPPVLMVAVLALILVAVLAVEAMKGLYETETERDLLVRAALLEDWAREHLSQGTFSEMSREARSLGNRSRARVTVTLPSGMVVADSEEDPSLMDDHSTRPEVQAVLRDGQPATSQRWSPTLDAQMVYAATPVYVGDEMAGVLRVAMPLTEVRNTVRALYGRLATAVGAASLLAALLSLAIARRIARPLEALRHGAERFAEGDLENRIARTTTQEVDAVGQAMNQMAEQMNDRLETISRQRNALEAVLSSMEEGVLAIDNAERVISINGAAAVMLDIDAPRSRGRLLQEVVRHPALQRFLQQVSSTSEPVTDNIELFGITGPRAVHAHGAALCDAEGKTIGALAVLHDVSVLRRLERIRRDFVANVSHELRTPVTSIKGFVETLLDGDLRNETEVRRFLGIISGQADRLEAIIEDLLSLSRLEQGNGNPPEPLHPHNLLETLQSAVTVCQPQADAKGIAVALQCDPELRCPMNPQLIEQAVVNLVDNAIKYSTSGKNVRIEAVMRDDQTTIAVADEGCGIERQHLPRIFERFYRVDRARSRKLGGTGLGLAIVKHIVQAHGGCVDVESQPGRGSTFTICLPREKSAS